MHSLRLIARVLITFVFSGAVTLLPSLTSIVTVSCVPISALTRGWSGHIFQAHSQSVLCGEGRVLLTSLPLRKCRSGRVDGSSTGVGVIPGVILTWVPAAPGLLVPNYTQTMLLICLPCPSCFVLQVPWGTGTRLPCPQGSWSQAMTLLAWCKPSRARKARCSAWQEMWSQCWGCSSCPFHLSLPPREECHSLTDTLLPWYLLSWISFVLWACQEVTVQCKFLWRRSFCFSFYTAAFPQIGLPDCWSEHSGV